nr:transposon Ty3-I Gag-Pol polyprotein [Tanacetum cinerariifolium]
MGVRDFASWVKGHKHMGMLGEGVGTIWVRCCVGEIGFSPFEVVYKISPRHVVDFVDLPGKENVQANRMVEEVQATHEILLHTQLNNTSQKIIVDNEDLELYNLYSLDDMEQNSQYFEQYQALDNQEAESSESPYYSDSKSKPIFLRSCSSTVVPFRVNILIAFHYFTSPIKVMAISGISISSDSSEECVGTSTARVILFGTIRTSIPSTAPTVDLPVIHDDTLLIPTDTPTISPIYSSLFICTDSSDSDPSERPPSHNPYEVIVAR